MAYVPGYKHDIFVSYAHFDNAEDAQEVRWVSRFHVDLKNALQQRLGQEPVIFYDTRDFEASDQLDILLEQARQSAVFLAVCSPSYVARAFTIGELTAFCDTGPNANRVVTVELLPVEDAQNHPLLLARKRTPFWWKDQAEQDIPLRLTPKFNPEMYAERLQILAHQVKKLLLEIRTGDAAPKREAQAFVAQSPVTQSAVAQSAVAQSAVAQSFVGQSPVAKSPVAQSSPVARPQPAGQSAPPPPNRTVLLAQTTDDLYDESERVRAYLEQFGVKVLPETDFPQGGGQFATAFEAELDRAGIFVQLLGTFASRKPPDLTQTYSQYQYESAKTRGLKTLQWRRPDLDLTAVTHRDKPLLEGADVLAVGLEEFKAEILRLCTPEPKREVPQLGDCHFFINADRTDKDMADQLLKLFEDKKTWTAARPLFEGGSAKDRMDDLEANLRDCDALLLVYGNAPPTWVRAQLLRHSKLERQRQEPLRLKTILLGPPKPKDEIAWSGGFDMVDCQDGDLEQRVRGILDGLSR